MATHPPSPRNALSLLSAQVVGGDLGTDGVVLTPAEERHVTSCDACQALLKDQGQVRALRMSLPAWISTLCMFVELCSRFDGWVGVNGCVLVPGPWGTPQVEAATVAAVAFHDPVWTQRSELLNAVATCAADAVQTTKLGGAQYLSTLSHKDRQWVQLLPSLAPLTPFPNKPGYVPARAMLSSLRGVATL